MLTEIDAGSDTTFGLSDGLGSVRGLTDDNGNLIGSVSYDSFGRVTTQSGATSTFGYTGEQTDPTGSLYLRARTYDMDSGRFLSADSVQPNAPGTQGYNRYAYVANNPTTWTDPTGHLAQAAAAPVLVSAWLPIGIALAAIYIADCAAQSPLGFCNALAAFAITVFAVVACVLEVGGPCWDWVPLKARGKDKPQDRPLTRDRTKTRDGAADPPGGQRPPLKPCRTAIKILTEFDRLAGKLGIKLTPNRLAKLKQKRADETITIEDLGGGFMSEFPGEFRGMTLKQIREFCGMKR